MDARKKRIGPAEALAIVGGVRNLWVAKGKRSVHIDMEKERPGDDELLRLLIGPSGNLRAPSIRKGDSLFVGFHEDDFAAELT